MQDETIVKVYYCPDCYEHLEELGYPAVCYFEIIVETCIMFSDTFKHVPHSHVQYKGGLEFLEISNHPRNRYDTILELLEDKGFITSTDVFDDTFIDIMPNGLYYDDDKYYVCIDNDTHDFVDEM